MPGRALRRQRGGSCCTGGEVQVFAVVCISLSGGAVLFWLLSTTVTCGAAAGREAIFEVRMQCVSVLVQALVPAAISVLETGLLRLPESCLRKSRSKGIVI